MAIASQRPETLSCELLEWDSEHFGFPVGQVVGDTLTPRLAEAIDDWSSDQGIRCVYLRAGSADAETARVAARHGYRVVDVPITGRRLVEEVTELPFTGAEKVAVREATGEDLEYARRLASRSHHTSRFYFDGSFPRERCDALYEAFVVRGFRDPNRTLRVPLVDGEPAGYHVLGPLGPDREGHGELVAIDERHRGMGVGQAMHVSTLRLLAARGAVTHRGVFSARNVASVRYHLQLGFLISRVDVWHHKWYW
jgi:GNAT superfamily N-acetyltransferase